MPMNAYLVLVCVAFGVRNCLDGMCGLFILCLRRICKGVHCICKIWKGTWLSITPTLKSVHSKGNQLSVPKSKLRMNHPNLVLNSHKPYFLSAEYKETRYLDPSSCYLKLLSVTNKLDFRLAKVSSSTSVYRESHARILNNLYVVRSFPKYCSITLDIRVLSSQIINFCSLANFFYKHPKGREVHAGPLDDESHDHDFVRKVLRRPTREDCRHEAAEKMLRSVLQQRRLIKFLPFGFLFSFLLQMLIPTLHVVCGVARKFIKLICLLKSHFLKS
ncbi:unnamed protein product [Sphenostylis stenocarpa]|uniref:Uncharacterized protein n=1 Tax=Sphenostylis stenocarpa TaxID=92480 RepID=A0AA86S6R1_9FABA|nr:unnamed protein product [Sphenostylis stenocarpa]